ncbi:MAG: hypothetical protein V1809_10765 [Planctomycetota bacterium]
MEPAKQSPRKIWMNSGVLAAILVLLFVFLQVLIRMPIHHPAHGTRCKNNLRQIYCVLATYVDDFGDHHNYPKLSSVMSGADFLLAPYFSNIIENPDIFICPATKDTNHDGKDFIGRNVATDPRVSVGLRPGDWRLVSYAGFDVSLAPGGVLADNAPADTVIACDDEEDEGGPSIPGARSAKSNHEVGKYNALFLDGHVESILDPFAGTGGKNQMIAGKVKPLDMMKN